MPLLCYAMLCFLMLCYVRLHAFVDAHLGRVSTPRIRPNLRVQARAHVEKEHEGK